MVELSNGDRLSVVLPKKWTVEDSNANDVYLFGHGEGAIFIDEADCESAQACQELWSARFDGETAQETIGGVTYYEHRYYVDWAGDMEHWYADWNGHVYDVNLNLIGKAADDPTGVQAVARSVEWLP